MDYDFLLKSYDMAGIHYKKDECLSNKCTFKTGSTADIYVVPKTIEQFQSAVGAAHASGINYFILGGGSNVLFPDTPYNGIIISTEELNNLLMTDDTPPEDCDANTVLISCQTGTTMSSFVNFCTKHNLSGAEQFAGLPGTIGGAVYMNARCFDKSICELIYDITVLTVQDRGKTQVTTEKFNPTQWDYKISPFQTKDSKTHKFILSVTFKLTQKNIDSHAEIESACRNFISKRIEKGHFKYPSAGSVFKNNRQFGKPSGQIIDEAGLKGKKIGGAQIAPFHGNFIINMDHATSKDISELITLTQETVKNKFNFTLEPEIIFVKN